MKYIDVYAIRTISNLHVGSGEGDFSVVDKQVQRDPVTGLPTIHASGIKGALREYMEYIEKYGQDPAKKPLLKDIHAIFGAPPKGENRTIQQGLNNFFDGKLLALPVRSSHDFFYVATCPMLLKGLISDLETFCPKNTLISPLKDLAKVTVDQKAPKYFGAPVAGSLTLEDWTGVRDAKDIGALKGVFGDRIALLNNDDFAVLSKELPIIARNYLENGISQNLWYEEVVPREARFYAMISRHQATDDLNTFLANHDHLVQLGANATVGYGLCEFKKL